MAFQKKTWTDRIAEYINRRLLTKEDGSTELVTVARSEGTISQEGDAFNADTMNDLEDRIAAGFEQANSDLESHIHDDRYYTEAETDALLAKKFPIKGAQGDTIDAVLEDGAYIMNGTQAVGTFPTKTTYQYGIMLAVKRWTNSIQILTNGVRLAIRNYNKTSGGQWYELALVDDLSDFVKVEGTTIEVSCKSSLGISGMINNATLTPPSVSGYKVVSNAVAGIVQNSTADGLVTLYSLTKNSINLFNAASEKQTVIVNIDWTMIKDI